MRRFWVALGFGVSGFSSVYNRSLKAKALNLCGFIRIYNRSLKAKALNPRAGVLGELSSTKYGPSVLEALHVGQMSYFWWGLVL